MSACRGPIDGERLVGYFAGELEPDDEAAVEEHLFGCAGCAEEAGGVASITETVRAMVPPVVTRSEVDRLRAKGTRIGDRAFVPGERSEAHFTRDLDMLLFHLTGVEADPGDRVDFTMHDEATGRTMVLIEDAPYDAGSGELLLCCQRHYAVLPPDVVAEVRVTPRGAAPRSCRYTILHRFA